MTGTSVLRPEGRGSILDLATGPARIPEGLVPGRQFFSGFVDRADVVAAGLLAVADVAGSRYADAGLAQRLANMDPVVTASGDRLRFESFSQCNGVHARFDLLRPGLGSSEVGFGTTNVDVNLPLRTALTRIQPTEPLHLVVGADELRASSLASTFVEPKVPLPDRWVRGLAETATLLSEMTPVGSLPGVRARQFLSVLPRVAPPGPDLHVLPFPTGWRTATLPAPGAIPLIGASRMRGADRILRYVVRLTVHRQRHGSTAWVFELPGASLTLALSPGPYRGFSGEGTLLALLAHLDAERDGRQLLRGLAWSPVVDPEALARSTGLAPVRVRAGLAWLAASGRLGFDLDERAWFHRELPVDSDAALRRNPRLIAARRLVDREAVMDGSRPGRWRVAGSHGATYTVSGGSDCTCRWTAEYGDTRGPCKHVLAVLMTLRTSPVETDFDARS